MKDENEDGSEDKKENDEVVKAKSEDKVEDAEDAEKKD